MQVMTAMCRSRALGLMYSLKESGPSRQECYNFVQHDEVIAADAAEQREGARIEGDLIALRRGRTRPL